MRRRGICGARVLRGSRGQRHEASGDACEKKETPRPTRRIRRSTTSRGHSTVDHGAIGTSCTATGDGGWEGRGVGERGGRALYAGGIAVGWRACLLLRRAFATASLEALPLRHRDAAAAAAAATRLECGALLRGEPSRRLLQGGQVVQTHHQPADGVDEEHVPPALEHVAEGEADAGADDHARVEHRLGARDGVPARGCVQASESACARLVSKAGADRC